MMKHIILSLSALSLSLLQACGGGDGDKDAGASGSNGPAAAAPTSAGVGSVSAKFAAGKDARYIRLSLHGQSLGNAENAEQADNGAVLRLGSNSLSGSHQTVDIAGDAHFALGRWVKGTITDASDAGKTSTLTGKDEESHHYIVYKRLEKLPVSGQIQCHTVAATAPTAVSDARAKVGSASGSATVSFDDNGAKIKGSIELQAGGETGTTTLDTQIREAASMSVIGLLLGPGAGAGMVLANQGSDVPALIVAYRGQLPGAGLYNGVARFACTKS